MPLVDLQRREVVYYHLNPQTNEVFHIGSGSLARAFSDVRGKPWQDYVSNLKSYEVRVVERHTCPARARLREAELIHEMQPVTDLHHRNGPHMQLLRGFTKAGLRCDCNATDCYGREAVMRYS